MQITLTDKQLARLTAMDLAPTGKDENAAHSVGMRSGALQFALAMKSDADRMAALAHAEKHIDGAISTSGLQKQHEMRVQKSAVDGFIDVLEMQAGMPMRIADYRDGEAKEVG